MILYLCWLSTCLLYLHTGFPPYNNHPILACVVAVVYVVRRDCLLPGVQVLVYKEVQGTVLAAVATSTRGGVTWLRTVNGGFVLPRGDRGLEYASLKYRRRNSVIIIAPSLLEYKRVLLLYILPTLTVTHYS